jgi:cell division septation protein DedD
MNPNDADKNTFEFESYESQAGTTVESIPPVTEPEHVHHIQDSEAMDISAMSVDEEVANISQEAQESEAMDVSAMSVEKDLPLPPKGAYSVDFDKFDDTNFNPFETKKAMQNSPPPGEEALTVPKGAYTVELDKFDDPNFNPFESKRAMSNSPVDKPTIKSQESQEPVASATEHAPTPEKNPVEEPNNETFTLEKEDAPKESTTEGLAELNQTFTPPKEWIIRKLILRRLRHPEMVINHRLIMMVNHRESLLETRIRRQTRIE